MGMIWRQCVMLGSSFTCFPINGYLHSRVFGFRYQLRYQRCGSVAQFVDFHNEIGSLVYSFFQFQCVVLLISLFFSAQTFFLFLFLSQIVMFLFLSQIVLFLFSFRRSNKTTHATFPSHSSPLTASQPTSQYRRVSFNFGQFPHFIRA